MQPKCQMDKRDAIMMFMMALIPDATVSIGTWRGRLAAFATVKSDTYSAQEWVAYYEAEEIQFEFLG